MGKSVTGEEKLQFCFVETEGEGRNREKKKRS